MYCNCRCHRTPGMMHCYPCCATCPYCYGNISRSYIKKHIKEHEDYFESLRQTMNSDPLEPSGSGKLPPANPLPLEVGIFNDT